MQTRTLLQLVERIEQVLPEFKALIDDLKILKNNIKAGKFDSLEIKDRGDVNVQQLVDELKTMLANTPRTEDEVQTRARKAIYWCETYTKELKKCGLDIGSEVMQHLNYSQVTIPSISGQSKPEEASVLSRGPIGLALIKSSPPQLGIISVVPPSRKPRTVKTLFQANQGTVESEAKTVKFSIDTTETRSHGLNRGSTND